jgi:integrase
VRPRTVKDYHTTLRTFFRWLVEEGCPDQIQPLTKEDVYPLLLAAKQSDHSYRDEAILLFLLDTGVRASELCILRIENVDVVGKLRISLMSTTVRTLVRNMVRFVAS